MDPFRRLGSFGTASCLQLAFVLLWLSAALTPGLAGQDAYLVKDINTSTGEDRGARAVVNDTLFFAGHDDANGTELWKSDGTPQGTALLKDIFPGRRGSYLYRMVNAGGTLFFAAEDGIHGCELWKSNGTPEGTVMVKDIKLGKETSYPHNLTNVNGVLFFVAADGLWKSDGTPEGTVMVKDGVSPYELADLNGTLLFGVFNSAGLWKSDGTTEGTLIVHQELYPSSLTRVANTLFFVGGAPGAGRDLWKSEAHRRAQSPSGMPRPSLRSPV